MSGRSNCRVGRLYTATRRLAHVQGMCLGRDSIKLCNHECSILDDEALRIAHSAQEVTRFALRWHGGTWHAGWPKLPYLLISHYAHQSDLAANHSISGLHAFASFLLNGPEPHDLFPSLTHSLTCLGSVHQKAAKSCVCGTPSYSLLVNCIPPPSHSNVLPYKITLHSMHHAICSP